MEKEEKKNDVLIFPNTTSLTNASLGKVLQLKSEDLKSMLSRAASAFGFRESAKRLFTRAGGEVEDIDEIFPGDALYLSMGEDFGVQRKEHIYHADYSDEEYEDDEDDEDEEEDEDGPYPLFVDERKGTGENDAQVAAVLKREEETLAILSTYDKFQEGDDYSEKWYEELETTPIDELDFIKELEHETEFDLANDRNLLKKLEMIERDKYLSTVLRYIEDTQTAGNTIDGVAIMDAMEVTELQGLYSQVVKGRSQMHHFQTYNDRLANDFFNYGNDSNPLSQISPDVYPQSSKASWENDAADSFRDFKEGKKAALTVVRNAAVDDFLNYIEKKPAPQRRPEGYQLNGNFETADDYLPNCAETIRTRFQPLGPITIMRWVVARQLQTRFHARWEELNRGQDRTSLILAFHGTHQNNFHSIEDRGLLAPGEATDIRVVHGQALGHGIYLATDPRVSAGYAPGNAMYACLVLRGGCTVHGNVLVARSGSYVLPIFLIHWVPQHAVPRAAAPLATVVKQMLVKKKKNKKKKVVHSRN